MPRNRAFVTVVAVVTLKKLFCFCSVLNKMTPIFSFEKHATIRKNLYLCILET